MVTITDVATLAGVSMKTVSRVLNNEAHVRPALREQVMRAVAELGYRPNLAARQLAANRSFLIAFIMRDLTVSYYAQIVVAAAIECRRHGYHLVSETFGEDEMGDGVVGRVVGQLRPDGIILAPPLCNNPDVVAAVEKTGVPLVRIAGTVDGYGVAITMDEHDAARDLVRHLVALGHRRIALIAPPATHGAAQGRVAGYRAALEEAGIAFDPALTLDGDFSFASGALAMEHLMRLPDRPTAVFAGNDGMALGALAIAHRDGIAVPGEVAIAGFDDSPASRMVFPALTTVRQPFAGMAQAAVAAILGREPAGGSLVHELMVRGSTTGSREMDLSAVDA